MFLLMLYNKMCVGGGGVLYEMEIFFVFFRLNMKIFSFFLGGGGNMFTFIYSAHRLNMELDLQNLIGLHVPSCTHWLRP